MLKLAIAATVSIVSLLSIASIADARSINLEPNHYDSLDRPKTYLVAKQSNSSTDNIPQADIQGIHQSLSNYFHDTNQLICRGPEWSSIYYKYMLRGKTCGFLEAKSVQIVSFSNTKAQVKVEIEKQQYFVKIIQQHPPVLAFKKDSSSNSLEKRIYNIDLTKTNEKWQMRR